MTDRPLPTYPDVTLALLAGGKGVRLGGVAKGLLLLEGRTLLERLLALASRFGEVLLVTPEPAPYAAYGLRSVADVFPGRGAPGGAHAALAHARTPWVLTLAADMPFVTGAVVDLLLAGRTETAEAVAFELHGHLEPLLACYRAALAPRWAEELPRNPSLRALLELGRTERLSEEALAQVDPELKSPVSINRPEDMARYGVCFRDGAPPMR